MIVSFWPTQLCLADSRCAKDTSTAIEHAQNAREREARPLIKKMFPKQIIRESLEV